MTTTTVSYWEAARPVYDASVPAETLICTPHAQELSVSTPGAVCCVGAVWGPEGLVQGA